MVALVEGGATRAERSTDGTHGSAERLARLVAEVFEETERSPSALGGVAVTTGPGSFTGLRAAIAFAAGFGRAVGVPVVGIPGAQTSGRSADDRAPTPRSQLDLASFAVAVLLDGPPSGQVLPLYADSPGARLRVAPMRPAPRDAGPVVASVAYAAVLAALHAEAFPPAERWSTTAFASLLGQSNTFALHDPNAGLVLARVAADEAEILTLGVLPAVRRTGRGRRLLDTAKAEAARRGAKTMFLEVAADNDAARALYVSEGFVSVARRPAYYPGGGDAVLLRLDLGAVSAAGVA